jgi:hypothetical protein
MRVRLAVAFALVVLLAPSTPRVAILRATYVAFEDESIRVVVQVEPHARNRFLFVMVVDGSEVVTSTLKQLEGDQARRTWEIDWRRVPYGSDMQIVASLYEDSGKVVARAQRPITVLSRR